MILIRPEIPTEHCVKCDNKKYLQTVYNILESNSKCDLLMCYKIIHNKIIILNDDFLVFFLTVYVLDS